MSFDRSTRTTAVQTEPYLYLSDGEVPRAAGERGVDTPWDPQAPLGRLRSDVSPEFENGVLEGERRARAAYEKPLADAATAIISALEAFRKERAEYFSRVEPEVVQLALAIARKILHREAQMDPLLLAGMVHVALDKVDSGTRVRMRAHPTDIAFWAEYFSHTEVSQPAPETIGDSSLQRGECALETEVGSTHISLETQLKEIEQGFFDLLEQRPRVR